MNTVRKSALYVITAIGLAGPAAAAASPSLVVAAPDISVLTAEIGRWIADEFVSLQRVLLSVPRVARPERVGSVTIFEGPNHMIVTAARLRPDPATTAAAAQP